MPHLVKRDSLHIMLPGRHRRTGAPRVVIVEHNVTFGQFVGADIMPQVCLGQCQRVSHVAPEYFILVVVIRYEVGMTSLVLK